MVNKTYSLAAWTENGQLRMIPSLVDELSAPYREKIARIEGEEYEDEIGWLFALSRAWEEFARYYLGLGYFMQAYQCYGNAARVCTWCSDRHWRQGPAGVFPTLPLLYRFLSMHKRCLALVKDHPALKYEYEDSDLESCFLSFTIDDRITDEEFSQSYESMRAWRFGRR